MKKTFFLVLLLTLFVSTIDWSAKDIDKEPKVLVKASRSDSDDKASKVTSMVREYIIEEVKIEPEEYK